MEPASPKYGIDLKRTIFSVIGENPDPRTINKFIFLCRKIASVQIRRKLSSGRLHSEFFNSSPDDIALDCIAELFQTDDSGSFIQIKTFFDSLLLDEISEEDLLSHLRRLVFSRVNQSIFRIYNEMDPSLGKILRNVKLAVHTLGCFAELDRFGEQCITPSSCETLEELPQADRNDLENELRGSIDAAQHIPAIMSKLAMYLRKQGSHSRIVPIMTLAVILRSIYAGEMADGCTPPADPFTDQESRSIIKNVCQNLMNETGPKYLDNGKVEEITFKKYFEVIEGNLIAVIINQDGERASFFTGLKNVMPDLTEKEYKRDHKSRIEYLGRLAHKRAIRELRKNL